MTVVQGTMSGLGSTLEIGGLDTCVEHIELSHGAWLDVRRRWISGADLLFERLVQTVPWRAERRPMYERVVDVPRLLAFYGEGDPLPDEALSDLRTTLRAHYREVPGGDLQSAGLCLYRDGRDSVAWHGDRFGRGRSEDVIVAIVSLGHPRAFLVRPRGGGSARRFVLDSGDLFVMGGSCQRTWEHCVPKTTRPVGPRVSVQFRSPDVR